jgi:nitrate/TMAO reductase-like tetraheme cytochrome c subunit
LSFSTVPRYVQDEFELPDDEDDLPYEGKIYRRRPRRFPGALFIALVLVVMGGAAVASFLFVTERQQSDAFCVSCHTPQHEAYLDRARASVGGALAPDLSSFHYQQIEGLGGQIRCIDCHRGNNTTRHQVDTFMLSIRLTGQWLLGDDDRRLEKTAITSTVGNGITETVPQTALALIEPRLTNASCIRCHTDQLLVAGIGNHYHNTLPAVYDAWKNGASLIPPKDAPDPQAIVAQGLVPYNNTLQCHSCHQTHRTLDTPNYLDMQRVVKPACEQCHRQTGRGPEEVILVEEQ